MLLIPLKFGFFGNGGESLVGFANLLRSLGCLVSMVDTKGRTSRAILSRPCRYAYFLMGILPCYPSDGYGGAALQGLISIQAHIAARSRISSVHASRG